eukprot:2507578-Karenia_brevis.AAC.1
MGIAKKIIKNSTISCFQEVHGDAERFEFECHDLLQSHCFNGSWSDDVRKGGVVTVIDNAIIDCAVVCNSEFAPGRVLRTIVEFGALSSLMVWNVHWSEITAD